MAHKGHTARSAALGMAAVVAAGMVGGYLASENRRELKKMMKKAEKGAIRALDQIEQMRR